MTSLLKAVRVGAFGVGLLVAPTIAQAQATGRFGGLGYSDFNSAVGFGNRYIWHSGDYWQQLVSGTGFATVRALDLSLFFTNGLNSGNSQTFLVKLNGTGVGSFIVGEGQVASADSYVFSPVASVNGSDFVIQLLQTSPDVPTGGGATQLTWRTSTYSLTGATVAVPEPGSLVLLSSGLAGLGVMLRHRRRRAS